MHNTFKQSTAKENKDKEKIDKKWRKAPWNLVQILQRSKNGKCRKQKQYAVMAAGKMAGRSAKM